MVGSHGHTRRQVSIETVQMCRRALVVHCGWGAADSVGALRRQVPFAAAAGNRGGSLAPPWQTKCGGSCRICTQRVTYRTASQRLGGAVHERGSPSIGWLRSRSYAGESAERWPCFDRLALGGANTTAN